MGTSREADLKSMRRFCIGATVIIGVIALMTYGNLFNTYLYDYFKAGLARENLVHGAGARFFLKITHYLGAVSFAAAVWWVWNMADYTWSERQSKVYGTIAIAFVVLGILLAAGFNFDLHGIEPGA